MESHLKPPRENKFGLKNRVGGGSIQRGKGNDVGSSFRVFGGFEKFRVHEIEIPLYELCFYVSARICKFFEGLNLRDLCLSTLLKA